MAKPNTVCVARREKSCKDGKEICHDSNRSIVSSCVAPGATDKVQLNLICKILTSLHKLAVMMIVTGHGQAGKLQINKWQQGSR